MIDLLDEMELDATPSGTTTDAELADLARRSDAPSNECHLCGSPPRLRCQACDRPACGKDSWVMLGLCRTCATESRMRLWHERNHNVSGDWLGGD